MKKANRKSTAVGRPPAPAMRPEYDFSGGVRGKYAGRDWDGTNLVLLDDDVAAVFPDAAAVNTALRALIVAGATPPPTAAG